MSYYKLLRWFDAWLPGIYISGAESMQLPGADVVKTNYETSASLFFLTPSGSQTWGEKSNTANIASPMSQQPAGTPRR